MEKKFKVIGIIAIVLVATLSIAGYFFFYEDVFEEATVEPSDNDEKSFRKFHIGNYNFSSIDTATHNNSYFNLNIGYRITLEGEDEGEDILVNITVQNQTVWVAGIETRVVTEEEYEDGDLIEISYNYFALCNETLDVIYFGELSVDYEDGEIVGHGGSWSANESGHLPGIMMPGTFRLGDRYYQEYALEAALDRAENVAKGKKFDTPIGVFYDCVITEETNALEPFATEYKVYTPGVGIIADERLLITFEGTVKTYPLEGYV